jgi:hypothetical protein
MFTIRGLELPCVESVAFVAGNHFALTFTAMFPYAFQSIFPAKAPKTAENQNGMVIAQSTAIAFVPTKLGRG